MLSPALPLIFELIPAAEDEYIESIALVQIAIAFFLFLIAQ